MKISRKIASLSLALALAAGLAVPAMAATDVRIQSGYTEEDAYQILGVEGREAGGNTVGETAPTDTGANGTSANTVTMTVPGDKYHGHNGNFVISIFNVVSTETKSYSSQEVTVYSVPRSGTNFSIAYNDAQGDYWLPAKVWALHLEADGSYRHLDGHGYRDKVLTPDSNPISIEEKGSNWIDSSSNYIFCIWIGYETSQEPLFYFQFTDEPAPAPTVAPSPCAATLDGKPITLNAYLFAEGSGGTNYVMLRDVAALLNGSKAQFEVIWDKDKGIVLTTGDAYTPVGGELQGKGGGNKPYTANASTITIDGKPVELSAYTIEGNNYFKLRDLGAALGFGVDWDAASGTVVIDTAK